MNIKEKACKNADFWGEDLSPYNGFVDTVSYWYNKLKTNASDAPKEVLE